MNLDDASVFITGAAGFIGGHVAERLWLEHATAARCLVQNISGAARLARLPVMLCPGDILNRDTLKQALGDSDIVIHCAYGNTPDVALNRRINEEGLRNLGEAALDRGVRRFIHLSTIAVYGTETPELVTEETPVRFSGDEYGDSKIRAEAICRELMARGLPLVIVRPTIVYGPFSPIWTVGAIKRVMAGGWENTADVDGLCNPVYVGDLVSGIFLCIENDRAIGETFNLSGSDVIPWNDYYQAYKDVAGMPAAPPSAAGGPMGVLRPLTGRFLRSNIRLLRHSLEPQMISIYEWMKLKHPTLAANAYRMIHGGLEEDEKRKFRRRTVYSIAKAQNILGYAPRLFAEGMKPTGDWLIYYEFV
jgi:nucleoside-diphosphate-sugar epimerase